MGPSITLWGLFNGMEPQIPGYNHRLYALQLLGWSLKRISTSGCLTES